MNEYHIIIPCETCKYKNYKIYEYPCCECCTEDSKYEQAEEKK